MPLGIIGKNEADPPVFLNCESYHFSNFPPAAGNIGLKCVSGLIMSTNLKNFNHQQDFNFFLILK